jgi:mannose-6-phosphate isomerase-like protein (cupin superfamily)
MRRDIYYTQEVLIIRKGALRVDFYNDECIYLESTVIREGDILLIASGGHGFEVLEELEMIEIKQGPFVGEYDKSHFPGVSSEEIRCKNEES